MSRVPTAAWAAAVILTLLASGAAQADDDAVYECSNGFSPFHVIVDRGMLWDELVLQKGAMRADGDSFEETLPVIAADGDWIIESGDTIVLAGARMQCSRLELNTVSGAARLTCGGTPFTYACRPVPAVPY